MHLFDEDAAVERALCGEDTDANDRRGVRGYLEDRRDGNRTGTVCQDCQGRAVPFVGNVIEGLEAEGRTEEAGEYRRLAVALAGETGRDGNGS